MGCKDRGFLGDMQENGGKNEKDWLFWIDYCVDMRVGRAGADDGLFGQFDKLK